MDSKDEEVVRHCDGHLKDIYDLAVHAQATINERGGIVDWESVRRALLEIRHRAEGGISQIRWNQKQLTGRRDLPPASSAAESFPPDDILETGGQDQDEDD